MTMTTIRSTARAAKRVRRPRGDVRAHVLTAATRLFAAHGFDGTTLQEVADAVGVRKPTVLHYFATKEALLDAVNRQVLEHWSQVVPVMLRDARSGPSQFQVLMSELINFYSREPDRARLVLRKALDRPEAYRSDFSEEIMPWLDLIGQGVAEGQRRGICRPDVDPRSYLILVVQLVIVTIATADVFPGKEGADARSGLDHALRELMRMARDSLFAGPPEQRRPPALARTGDRSGSGRPASGERRPRGPTRPGQRPPRA